MSEDELRPEYDLSKISGAIKGKYAERYKMGTNLVHLEPDVAAVFRSDEAVNKALRSIIEVAKAQVSLSE